MNCPRCDGKALHVTTEPGSFNTTVRRFRCCSGHLFNTIEAYQPTAPVERHQLAKVLRAIAATFTRKENAA